MPGDGGLDPREAARAAAALGDASAHGALLAAGVGAAVLRLALYSGPPRPVGAALLDCFVMLVVGFGAAELAFGIWGNMHVAIGTALTAGVLGWETVKRLATARVEKEVR